MISRFALLATVVLMFCLPLTAMAGFGTHGVIFTFQAIDELSVTGSPSVTVNTATAGSQPDDAVVSSGTYSISTNGTNKLITASIDTAMPDNTTLSIQVTAPTASGTSLGYVALSTTAANVVTGMSNVAESALTIDYKLSATVDAGVVTTNNRTVTLTLTD